MPFYLQRVRFTVHTKKRFLAGTNSTVKLCYLIEEKHVHPKLEPGVHDSVLDHPWHVDFQSGKSDSYEISLGTGKLGKSFMGRPMLNEMSSDPKEGVEEYPIELNGSFQT
jgi:hypothetical protein